MDIDIVLRDNKEKPDEVIFDVDDREYERIMINTQIMSNLPEYTLTVPYSRELYSICSNYSGIFRSIIGNDLKKLHRRNVDIDQKDGRNWILPRILFRHNGVPKYIVPATNKLMKPFIYNVYLQPNGMIVVHILWREFNIYEEWKIDFFVSD